MVAMTDYTAKVMAHQNTPLWTANADAVLSAAAPLKGQDVLDFGCGPGRLSRMLSWEGAKVTGVDVAAMIRAAKEHAGPIRYVEIDEFEFYAGQFDVVVAANVLGHVPDLQKTLDDLVQVARNGGRIVVLNPNAVNTYLRWPTNLLKGYRSDPTIRQRFGAKWLDREMLYRGCQPIRTTMLGETYLGTHSMFLSVFRKRWGKL